MFKIFAKLNFCRRLYSRFSQHLRNIRVGLAQDLVARICLAFVQVILKIWSQDVFNVCSWTTQDMFKICTSCAQDLHKTCSTLVQDQLKICSRSTRDMFKICTRLAQRLFKICTRNGREFAVTKSIEVPTWNGEKVVFALIGIGRLKQQEQQLHQDVEWPSTERHYVQSP